MDSDRAITNFFKMETATRIGTALVHDHRFNVIIIISTIYSATTEQLVVKYEEQLQHFMDGTTLSQFKKLFPVSAVLSKQSTEKTIVILKLKNFWGNNTLNDLKKLVSLFGIPGKPSPSWKNWWWLCRCWLCSTIDAKKLKIAIFEANDSLKTKGVLQVFFGVELVLEVSQSDQGKVTIGLPVQNI